MSSGRPQQFDPVEVAHSALTCFQVNGYDATSTRRLGAACGVSSSTLYGALGGKRQLFISVIDLYTEQLLASMAIVYQGLPPARRDAQRFFTALFCDVAAAAETASGRYGCLLFNSLAEFGHSQTVEARHVRQALERIRRFFIDLLQQTGTATQQAEAAVFADAALMAMAGLRTMLRAGLAKKRAELVALQMVRSLFYPQEA